MKLIIAVLSCVLVILSCGPGSPKKAGSAKNSFYSITGKIDGLDTGWVYLAHRQSDSQSPDSARILNGSFTFKGASSAPEFLMLGIVNNGNKEFRLGFFAENGQMTIAGKKDSIDQAVVSGSATQDEYKSFGAARKSLDDEQGKLSKLYHDAVNKKDSRLTDSLEKVFDQFEKKGKDFVKDYARQHPASYVAALQVYENFSYNPDAKELDSVYALFDPTIQSSYYGKKIKETLDIAKKTDIGNAAPGFTMNTADGKPVTLASFKGRYVLIDFWASWCGPCRRENPAVVKAYQRYHEKGFDIFGVSLDDQKDKWVEAVKKDNLSWTHVSDLKGWQNSAAQLYGVQGIPMNFLVDREGKIIGKGLRGEELEKKLAETIK